MSNPRVASKSSSQGSWTNVAEWGAAIASFGGTVAAVLLEQIAFATIPLSFAAVLSITNRKQAFEQVSREINRLQSALELQQQNLTNLQTKTVSSIQERQNTESLQVSLQLQDCNTQLEELQLIARNLRTVQNCTQHLLNDPPPAESFYARAVGHHRLGDLREAILDYSEAIDRNQNNAKAYFNRGIAHTNVEDKQKAVQDFREAAKVFFKEGNIGAYSKAKELSENMHQLDRNQSPENFEDNVSAASDLSSSPDQSREEVSAGEAIVMESLFA
ncbi:MAG: tetratricopeptide repeat protein [Cyanobacteria bacterium J06642_11]